MTNQIRASYTGTSIRVYQAYDSAIAEPAIRYQSLVSPFRRERMTWIKPSFFWMMYRSGWASKPGQQRVLAIDIRRAGFDWAVSTGCLTHFDNTIHATHDEWRAALSASPVRIQWDPERGPELEMLPTRTIQIGLSGVSVNAYVDEWIVAIEDVTALALEIHSAASCSDIDRARRIAPVESLYPSPTRTQLDCDPVAEATT
jgi:Domain of unknown function (DUF4291)